MRMNKSVKELIGNRTWPQLFNILEVTTMGLKLYLKTRRQAGTKPTWRYWDFIRLREEIIREMDNRNARNNSYHSW